MARPHSAPACVVKKTPKKLQKAVPNNRKQSEKPSGKRARAERMTEYNSIKQRKQLGLESVPEHSTLDGNESDGPLPREFTAPSRSPSPGRRPSRSPSPGCMQEVLVMKSSGVTTVPKVLDNAATARFSRARKSFSASKSYHAKPQLPAQARLRESAAA